MRARAETTAYKNSTISWGKNSTPSAASISCWDSNQGHQPPRVPKGSSVQVSSVPNLAYFLRQNGNSCTHRSLTSGVKWTRKSLAQILQQMEKIAKVISSYFSSRHKSMSAVVSKSKKYLTNAAEAYLTKIISKIERLKGYISWCGPWLLQSKVIW